MTVAPHIVELYDTPSRGGVVSLLKAAGGSEGVHVPTRALGGWVMTYAKLGPNGELIETVDRERQTIDAARELGRIDWEPYIKAGRWNDTHDENTLVGLPTVLEYHDATSDLAKAHGKVGFWTAGHLWDRNDPQSWAAYGVPRPSDHELDAADRFWRLAQMLKGLPRPLGFSAHGQMRLSRDGRRVTWCQVTQAAVCQLPMNPDATAEILELAKAVRNHDAAWPLAKADRGASIPNPQPMQPVTETGPAVGEDLYPILRATDRLVRVLMQTYFLSKSDAIEFVRRYLRITEEEPDG